MEPHRNLNGKVCRSKRIPACIGLVFGIKDLEQGKSYVGLSLDPSHPDKPNADRLWASRDPEVIAESLDAYYRSVLSEDITYQA